MDVDESAISDTAHFVRDLSMDSLMGLEIMMDIEERYDVTLEEEEMRRVTCLMDCYQLLETKLYQYKSTK
jgi:acyl carrier protein